MDEPTPDPKCAICGRRLLPGERPIPYVTRDRAEVIVCELCKGRAEATGWLRPQDVAGARAEGKAGPGRSRRRQRGALLADLRARGEQLRRRVEPGERDERAEQTSGAPSPASAPVAREVPRNRPAAPAEQGRAVPAVDLNMAIAAFNASEFRRTVGGLNRSLGPPRASGLAVRTTSGASGARITVAWELAWYQWEIGPGKRGAAIRQSGKGETIDQLRAADRTWNLQVAENGELARKQAQAARPAPPPAEAQ
jgi:hypothetical protein